MIITYFISFNYMYNILVKYDLLLFIVSNFFLRIINDPDFVVKIYFEKYSLSNQSKINFKSCQNS